MNVLISMRWSCRQLSAFITRDFLFKRYPFKRSSEIARLQCNSVDTKRQLSSMASGSIIYQGPFSSNIRMTKLLSLSSTMFGLAVQPYLISHAASAHVALIIVVAGFVGFFTYVTPLLIHWLTKRYVVEMRCETLENKPPVFTATTYSFFLRPKHLSFRASDVQVPDVPGPFTSFKINGTPLLISSSHFTDLEAFKHLMGYDKPLDLKVNIKSQQS